MSSVKTEAINAEQRFRLAFERLKSNNPNLLDRCTPVSQNNVAREAGCDPSALRKSRFPALVREIQGYLELHKDASESKRQQNLRKTKTKRSIEERLADTKRQRDAAQSILASAERRIIELHEQVKSLQQRLNDQKCI